MLFSLHRRLRLFAAFVGLVGAVTLVEPLRAQEGSGGPAFEVASVKPIDMRGPGPSPIFRRAFEVSGKRVRIQALSMMELICFAYGVNAFQVDDPKRLTAVFYDIDALMPSESDVNRLPSMMQRLLTERFGLVVEMTSAEKDSYTLSIGAGALNLERIDSGQLPKAESAGQFDSTRFKPQITRDPVTGEMRSVRGGITTVTSADGKTKVEASGIADFAGFLSSDMGVPVLDRTGLSGYKVRMEVPVPESLGRRTPDMDPEQVRTLISDMMDTHRSLVVRAVEKLGLRLTRGKNPVPTLTIRALNPQPTEN
jgi:uncharacterized protein (TIGR03435 family)